MAFNKAKEERKWLNWKESEEKQMREFGVSEDVIEKIRKSDWTTFKAERCYYEKVISTDYIEYFSQQEYKKEYKTLEDFLNDIENQELYFILLSIDKISLITAQQKRTQLTDVLASRFGSTRAKF